jgi:hypothetical protein
MSADRINTLRDTFRVAMLDWDVPVSVTIEDDCASVCFTLWGTKLEGSFEHLEDDEWSDGNDCPHYIKNTESVWQWIAMKLHDKLTA